MTHRVWCCGVANPQLRKALTTKEEGERTARAALEAAQRTEQQLRVEVATASSVKGELQLLRDRSDELRQQVRRRCGVCTTVDRTLMRGLLGLFAAVEGDGVSGDKVARTRPGPNPAGGVAVAIHGSRGDGRKAGGCAGHSESPRAHRPLRTHPHLTMSCWTHQTKGELKVAEQERLAASKAAAEAAEATRRLADKDAELQRALSHADDLQRRVDAAEGALATVRMELDEAIAALANEREHAASADAELARVREEYERSTAELQEAQSDLETSRVGPARRWWVASAAQLTMGVVCACSLTRTTCKHWPQSATN